MLFLILRIYQYASMNTIINLFEYGFITLFIKHMNVVGELVKPNGTTKTHNAHT